MPNSCECVSRPVSVEYVAVDKIKPYENNPRINDESVDAVAASIKEFGFKNPIVVDKDFVIVCGHTRLKAALKLGLTEVPIVIASDLTDEQVRAFRLADNKVAELSIWDVAKLDEELDSIVDIDMTEFGFDLGNETIVDDSDFDVDEAAESIVDPVTKTGDIWQLGIHRLMCGDSTEPGMVSELLDGFQTDLLLTDPPYNVNYEGGTNEKMKIQNDNMESSEFCDFLSRAFKSAEMNMKPGASFYVWHAGMEMPNFMKAVESAGLKTSEILVWVKNVFNLGHYDYQWRHEPCLYGWKPGERHFWCGGRKQSTILEFDKPLANKEHPTMKPLEMFQLQIENSTKKGWRVLDLFGGSGTTIIACEKLGRIGYAMELDPKYCDVIVQRWEKATGKKAKKIGE